MTFDSFTLIPKLPQFYLFLFGFSFDFFLQLLFFSLKNFSETSFHLDFFMNLFMLLLHNPNRHYYYDVIE